MKHYFIGDSFEEKKKAIFIFNLMLIYFPLFKVDEGFCLLHEFLFCFSPAQLKVKTEIVKLHGLMLSPCVKGS